MEAVLLSLLIRRVVRHRGRRRNNQSVRRGAVWVIVMSTAVSRPSEYTLPSATEEEEVEEEEEVNGTHRRECRTGSMRITATSCWWTAGRRASTRTARS